MKLYCQACHINHDFTAVEIEQLVYSLEADARENFINGQDSSDDISFSCIQKTANTLQDSEMFGDHVDEMIEERRRIMGLRGCTECNEDTPSLETKQCAKCKGFPADSTVPSPPFSLPVHLSDFEQMNDEPPVYYWHLMDADGFGLIEAFCNSETPDAPSWAKFIVEQINDPIIRDKSLLEIWHEVGDELAPPRP